MWMCSTLTAICGACGYRVATRVMPSAHDQIDPLAVIVSPVHQVEPQYVHMAWEHGLGIPCRRNRNLSTKGASIPTTLITVRNTTLV